MNLLTLAEIASRLTDGTWTGALGQASEKRFKSKDEIATHLATHRARLADVRHGDKVVVLCGQSVASILGMVALWERGAVVVPVANREEDEAGARVLAEDCNARFLFAPDTARLETLDGHRAEASRFTYLTDPKVSGADLAMIIYSSGSTGRPKGIMLTHGNVMASLWSIVRYLAIEPTDTILCVSPLSFDYGLYQTFFSFAVGARVMLFDEPMQPLRLLGALTAHDVSILPVVPAVGSALERTLAAYPRALPALKKITNTGGHLGAPVIESLQQKLPGVAIYCMYGLTESKRALYLPPADLARKLGSVGIPMPGLEAKVFIETQKRGETVFVEAGPDVTGELFVRGASVMQQYYHVDGGAGARLVPGRYRDDNWLGTGDLFSRDADGFFYFRGRKKELIKQGGFCLYPLDLENLVTRSPAVEMASVVGHTDAAGVETAWLFVKLRTDDAASRRAVLAHVDQEIGRDYRPRGIRFVDAMPLSTNGKVDKNALKEQCR